MLLFSSVLYAVEDTDAGMNFGGNLSLGNDLFAIPYPNKPDDNGFTSDLVTRLWLNDDVNYYGFYFRHRMITERGGMQRWDEVLFYLDYQRTYRSDDWSLYYGFRVGGFLCGDLKGENIQNWTHQNIANGRMDGWNLQDQYNGPNYRDFMVGGGFMAEYKMFSFAFLRAGVDTQVTNDLMGISFISGYQGIVLDKKTFTVNPYLKVGVSETVYGTLDKNMKMQGGYATGSIQFSPQIGFGVYFGQLFGLEYSCIFNEGGSGYELGVLSIEVFPWQR